MFDFSLGKLFLLALIALLVLGPDKLPGAARTVGSVIRRMRQAWENARSQLEREIEFDEIRRAAREAAAEAEAAKAQASDTLRQFHEEMDKVREQAARDVDDAGVASEEAATDNVIAEKRDDGRD